MSNGRQRKDEARPLMNLSAVCFLQCFDIVGWVTGRTSGWDTIPKDSLLKQTGGRRLMGTG